MIIHIYSLCWNEERMLPYYFRNYDVNAARYFIFDDASTDASLDILAKHPKVEMAEVGLLTLMCWFVSCRKVIWGALRSTLSILSHLLRPIPSGQHPVYLLPLRSRYFILNIKRSLKYSWKIR